MKDLAIWHYPRLALAESYLAALNLGIAVSTTIFAPRRMGKTTFLRRDLTPAAEKQGYTVVYADLWQTRQAPALALVNALEEAIRPKSAGAKLRARMNAPLKGIKAGAEFAGAKLSGEISLETAQKGQAETALLISSLLATLCSEGPVLLLVDEAQELARSHDNELVATALRTAITLNRDKLRVVFTGSSRTRLAGVFSNSNAPLYSSGVAITDFPLLDRNFIIFVLDKFRKASGTRMVDVNEAWNAFTKLRYQPEPFLKCIFHLLITPDLAFSDAFAHVQDELLRDENHDEAWVGLDSAQKTLVRMLAANPSLKPYSADVIADFRTRMGIDTIQKTHVQRALSRLVDAGIVSKDGGTSYTFENPAFQEWLLTAAD
nr:hypothetical protein [uncultured Noviherbaspirillum sp.]